MVNHLTLDKVSFRYKTRNVFSDINLDAKGGEILCLVGPNGAGKTTLLKCINRLLPPQSGSVCIDGQDVAKMKLAERAKSISYVPQGANTQFPVSVFDTILLGRRPYLNWKPKRQDLAMVGDIIDRMSLGDLAMRDLGEISGGERQKVIIAKAIVQEPRILLFDEPTTFLDLKYQLKIMEFIRALINEKQICAVITTHDLNQALQFADRIAVLKEEKIFAFGPSAALTEEVVREVYDVQVAFYHHNKRPFMIPLRAIE